MKGSTRPRAATATASRTARPWEILRGKTGKDRTVKESPVGTIQDSVRSEVVNILSDIASGTWTEYKLRSEPSKAYLMAWATLVEARHIVSVPTGEAINFYGMRNEPDRTFHPPTTGWTITLSGIVYLRELGTHPLRLHLSRHWFPLAVVLLGIVSNAIAVTVLLSN